MEKEFYIVKMKKRQANIVKNYNNKNNKGEFIEQFTVDQELI